MLRRVILTISEAELQKNMLIPSDFLECYFHCFEGLVPGFSMLDLEPATVPFMLSSPGYSFLQAGLIISKKRHNYLVPVWDSTWSIFKKKLYKQSQYCPLPSDSFPRFSLNTGSMLDTYYKTIAHTIQNHTLHHTKSFALEKKVTSIYNSSMKIFKLFQYVSILYLMADPRKSRSWMEKSQVVRDRLLDTDLN